MYKNTFLLKIYPKVSKKLKFTSICSDDHWGFCHPLRPLWTGTYHFSTKGCATAGRNICLGPTLIQVYFKPFLFTLQKIGSHPFMILAMLPWTLAGSTPRIPENIFAVLQTPTERMKPGVSSKPVENRVLFTNPSYPKVWNPLNGSGKWNPDGKELRIWWKRKRNDSSLVLSPNLNRKQFVKERLRDSAAAWLDILSLGWCGYWTVKLWSM